ncbi:hypothetical protein VNO77_44802 [Canavalia gladiata]|uniref:Uncharacterized protein n=1 Tax=Canavalia gladiata TaxID=3824 RepID=A0AAN9PR19_CANGL
MVLCDVVICRQGQSESLEKLEAKLINGLIKLHKLRSIPDFSTKLVKGIVLLRSWLCQVSVFKYTSGTVPRSEYTFGKSSPAVGLTTTAAKGPKAINDPEVLSKLDDGIKMSC